ncbi:stress responsive A/B barrel domain-containing protein [Massariosphaeria phaeospora]|uniref:Stress responsive A/B barrel domain-containing protein n=1 Tax=Massariosphaeria phaeospora TaxID=100035 RepID=A0A7C8IGR2_9PLEO|nr:stress responsive A/B barrel domain-containing protein [Massariosphaeria phaeospora]
MIIPKRGVGLLTLLLLLVGLATVIRTVPQLNPLVWMTAPLMSAPQSGAPFITHVVLFQFKHGMKPITIKQTTSKMLALKKSCIHPNTGSTYIVSISGGKDISIEKSQRAMTHAFLVQFRSREDRDYYVNEDPVHKAFKEDAVSVLQQTQVVDFQDGVFIAED